MEWDAPIELFGKLSPPGLRSGMVPQDAAVLESLAGTMALALGCDTVIVRVRDANMQWTSAQCGSTGHGCLLEQSLALAAADQFGPLIAPDAASHPLLMDHPLVANSSQVRSFAGIAAFADIPGKEEPVAIGVICAVAAKRREFGPETAALLENLAVLIKAFYAHRIELAERRLAQERLASELDGSWRLQRQFRQAERMAAIGSWRLSLADQQVHWSEGVYTIHELPAGGDVPVAEAINFYAPADRPMVQACLERAIRTGEGYTVEADFIGAKGTHKRVRAVGEVELVDGKPVALVGVFQDITEKHQLHCELELRANTDALTGLLNRARFNELLTSATQATSEHTAPLGLVLIDLDDFKTINDNAGHAAGDELLCRASAILQSTWLGDSVAARIGGDELVLLLRDQKQIDNLPALLERLTAEFSRPMDFDTQTIATSASIGASYMRPGGDCSASLLLEGADRALYEVKRERKGSYRIARPASCANCCADCVEHSTSHPDAEAA